MSKFTSGPWFITEQDPPEIHGSDERRTVICITAAPRSNEWNMADARLIAAAPEMYELLRGICEQRSHCFIPNDKDGLFCFDDKLVTLLAKIDGGA